MLKAAGCAFIRPGGNGQRTSTVCLALVLIQLFCFTRLTDAGQKLFFNEVYPEGVTTVTAGEQIELQCEAGGSPSPTIHWLYQGSRIMQRGSGANDVSNDEAFFEETPHNAAMNVLQVGSTNSRLVVDCVTAADAGAFTCVAETPFKRITATTQVKVESPMGSIGGNECARKHMKGGFPARINMWSAHRLEVEGADVQLYCRTEGRPAPTVTWFDRGGAAIVKEDPRFELLANGDLLIRQVNWMEHMGLYKCRAENAKGSQEETAFLYPTSP